MLFCLLALSIAGDRDGIPNVVPEALAGGMLVLASDRGAPEAFTDGETGFSMDRKTQNHGSVY